MARWFWRGLRRGVVTTGYPHRPDPVAATLPTPPAFHPGRLTVALADRLVAVCPSGALERSGDTLVLDVGACTACQRCLPVAGAAGRPSGVVEGAATDRDRLRVAIPIRGGA
ncbi:MAG TPA: hypothetical protein VMW49_01855 [Candidatus Dormibacteraeota bacterium]|nr:hypothetical protein [Candidatus Dormibacteraeota bacterium]